MAQINTNTTNLQSLLAYANNLLATGGVIPDDGDDSGSSTPSLPTGISAIATGTFTPTSDNSSDYTITHNLGVKPNFSVLMICNDISNSIPKDSRFGQLQLHRNVSGGYKMYGILMAYSGASIAAYNSVYDESEFATTTTVTFKNNVAISSDNLIAGYTYRWIVGVADGIQGV